MNARGFLDEVVKPSFARLKAAPADRSLIMSAAIVTSHSADWIADETARAIEVVRDSLRGRFADFEYLDAVANAHKHRALSRTRFKGLTDPLSEARTLVLLSKERRVLIGPNGKPLILKQLPKYRFGDGQAREPVPLIEGAIGAIEEELRESGL